MLKKVEVTSLAEELAIAMMNDDATVTTMIHLAKGRVDQPYASIIAGSWVSIAGNMSRDLGMECTAMDVIAAALLASEHYYAMLDMGDI